MTDTVVDIFDIVGQVGLRFSHLQGGLVLIIKTSISRFRIGGGDLVLEVVEQLLTFCIFSFELGTKAG